MENEMAKVNVEITVDECEKKFEVISDMLNEHGDELKAQAPAFYELVVWVVEHGVDGLMQLLNTDFMQFVMTKDIDFFKELAMELMMASEAANNDETEETEGA